MKVLVVAPYLPPRAGGLETYSFEVARHLVSDHDADVTALTAAHDAALPRVEVIDGVRVRRLRPTLRVSNTPIGLGWRASCRDVIRQEAPDVIHAHTPVPFLADMAERVRGSCPFVLTYHNDLMHERPIMHRLATAAYPLMVNRTLARAEAIVVTSDGYRVASPHLRSHLGKVEVIPPGVDSGYGPQAHSAKFVEMAAGRPVVLFVGQLDRAHAHKGLDDLIAAMVGVRRLHDACLIVVGAGDAARHYADLAASLGLRHHVTFAGRVDGAALPGFYAGADLMVLPSRTTQEGFGMVILEAAACGTPSLGTAVGGIPAAIEDGKTGVLVPRDDRASLVAAMCRLLGDSALRAEMGAAARRRVLTQFTWEQQAAKYARLFTRVIGDRGHRDGL